MTESPPQAPHERPGRRRPFSSLMKKLANFKSVSSNDSTRQTASKRTHVKETPKSKQSKKNNPYPQSGRIGISEPADHGRYSASTARSTRTSGTSLARGDSRRSSIEEQDLRAPPTAGGRSMAPTISTENETSRSMAASHGASSITGTSRTANVGNEFRRGGDSTFSSPAPSVRSLATTLTTIQSVAQNGNANLAPTGQQQPSGHHHAHLSNSQVIHFNQPFPTSSPASAIPAHLTPTPTNNPGHPTTYSSATANNLLTDNASILTLASSSKRRRRRSFDTDASVRALAPSSLFGGSRESLPLSVLSATVDGGAGGGGPTTPGIHTQRGQPAAERTSIYSASGILASERNSYYAKQSVGPAGTGDGASVRSGLLGHGRADSISGSIGGIAPASALASPREMEGEDEDQRASGPRGQADNEEGDQRD